MAGSDFIKTSTGKEGVNATLPVGIVMCRAIRDYKEVILKLDWLFFFLMNLPIYFIREPDSLLDSSLQEGSGNAGDPDGQTAPINVS